MNKNTLHTIKYIVADFLSAVIVWCLFSYIRKSGEMWSFNSTISSMIADRNFYLGIIIIPIAWLSFYFILGAYSQVLQKARMQVLGQTLVTTFLGTLLIFFALLLDDVIIDYRSYYRSFLILFSLQFAITFLFRFIVIYKTQNKIYKKQITFNTILVGSNGNASAVFHELENQKKSTGNKFVGFVYAQECPAYSLEEYLPNLGHYSNLKNVIESNNVEEVIIAIERSEQNTIEKIIEEIGYANVRIKILPEISEFIIGAVKTTSIYQTPLMKVSFDYMPYWQRNIKRLIDIVASAFAIVVLSPVYFALAIAVKTTSEGPVFYKQERVGLKGKKFMIPKFRSMYINAEKGTPMLSSGDDDPRITKVGKIMRKTRLDEIPQFYTVLTGKMSLVGPRPERQYFIDKIVEVAPHYKLLLNIKPGITSWGQVKYGYAANVKQMVERLKFDILYLENMTLAMDFKILAYTVLTVLKGSGK